MSYSIDAVGWDDVIRSAKRESTDAADHPKDMWKH